MQFLYFLEKLRNPVFDFLFSAITHLGEETFFLLIAIIFFWCIDKRRGYFIMMTGFFGTIINQIMKLALKIPRPWVKDPAFTIVESARAEATGYSFPSGHTQTAVGTFGTVFATAKYKLVKIFCIVIAVLVPLSRMYLGVHTPSDVLAATGCAMLIILILEPFFKNDKLYKKAMPYIVAAVTAASIAFFLYAVVFTKDKTDENVLSAAKNACTLLGCSFGLILVYVLDSTVIRFDTGAKWYSQIIKLVLGIAGVFLIKTFLKTPLASLLGTDYERIVRYFLIVAFAGCVWPLTFRYFSKLTIPALDRLGERVAAIFIRKDSGTKEKKASDK